jgi:hypothetical protein
MGYVPIIAELDRSDIIYKATDNNATGWLPLPVELLAFIASTLSLLSA